MKHKITYGEKYGPAMQVQTKEEAAAYFEECVEHTMEWRPEITREEAEAIERQNIDYYAGYYDNETMRRVYDLYETHHPVPGITPDTSPEETFKAGQDYAEEQASD
jgi:ribonucleotide reductase beta subunit family protein with ferritin-like domain